MQVVKMKLKDLVKARHNPKSRTGATHVAQLMKSIENVGLIYPIAVTAKKHVIDGHRRIAAYERLGIEEIPVIVVSTDNPDLAYAEINANSRYLNGNENLTVWLKNPLATTARAARQFENAENLIGRKLLIRIAENGLSMTCLRWAQKAASYVDRGEDRVFVARTVRWLISHRNSVMVRSYMAMQQSPQTLYKAITLGKDLKVHYEAGC